jgi:putative SOS response-associated peptidase YedK
MCGRASLSADERRIFQLPFGDYFRELPRDLVPRWNIAPTQPAVVARMGPDGKPELVSMRWGIQYPTRPTLLINARAETIAHKFKTPFTQRRCLMLVSGFYEWKNQGKRRLPHHITVKDQPVYGMAAIWESGIITGMMDNAFAVVTTDANEAVRILHDRMPVIVDPPDWNTWLDTSSAMADVKALLRSYPADKMQVTEVNEYVNAAGNEGPECHMPPAEPERTLFD